MERKINTPICLSDRIYAYVEENKIRYQFLMVASTITEFIPIRYPINTVVLPVLTKVYIPQTLSRKDMLERKADNFFYESGVHQNQTYVRDDSFDNLKIAKDVFIDYNKLKIVSASKSPIIIEEGAFADDAIINFVCPEGFELRVVSHKWKYWGKNNTLKTREKRYAIVGDKHIFDEIDGFLTHNKDGYSFLPASAMKLPYITVNSNQAIKNNQLIEVLEPELAEKLKNIDKPNFSFTRLLSEEDIVEILRRNNLKLYADDKSKKALFRRENKNGKHSIVAQCKHIKEIYDEFDRSHDLSETAMFKDIPLFKDTSKKYSLFNRPEMIVIEDFYMTEMVSLKSEREAKEYVLGLTKEYYGFMSEKFGSAYVEKAHEFFNSSKEADNTKEVNK